MSGVQLSRKLDQSQLVITTPCVALRCELSSVTNAERKKLVASVVDNGRRGRRNDDLVRTHERAAVDADAELVAHI